ncbi:DMT family protein [Persicobacter psychrovividus]|uniref:Membrane protein n=1 Tax=Persicobacter psychrovividus TaxID=387638 RepID=A0ABM7VCG8_9BACT|nr:membrane protein [Persicobacter psychrovividus]
MLRKGVLTIVAFILASSLMTFAQYGFLKFKWIHRYGPIGVLLFSWVLALFEYMMLLPGNKIGFVDNGGPFNLMHLKVMWEVIGLSVFALFSVFVFKSESFKWNHLVGFGFLVLSVFFIFKK